MVITGLNVENLSMEYQTPDGPNPALVDVNFHLNPCEILFIVGSNGSGKTTLLKAIAGAVEARGRVMWSHDGIEQIDSASNISSNVMWIPQDVNDVVASSLRIDELLSITNIRTEFLEQDAFRSWIFGPDQRSFSRRQVGELSGGQRQLLYGAIALSSGKFIFLLDEVFRPLDKNVFDLYWALIKSTVEDCKGIALVITHDLIFARNNAERLLIMNSGSVVSDLVGKDISLDSILKEMN